LYKTEFWKGILNFSKIKILKMGKNDWAPKIPRKYEKNEL
jgi:hypothetical protein